MCICWFFFKNGLGDPLTLLDGGEGGGESAQTLPQGYQLPFCTNQFQSSLLFPITSLLSSCKVILKFFCNFYRKITVNFFFTIKKGQKGSKLFFTQKYWHFFFQLWLWEFFWSALHVCRSKSAMLKIHSTSVTFLSLRNLEAATEEAMQLRRLIKSWNKSLGPYLFGKFEFWNF